MSRYIVLGAAVILNLALFSPCSALQAIPGAGGAQVINPARTTPNPSPPASLQSGAANADIANITVDRIEGGVIYSKDGRKFEISGSTRIIDNSRSNSAAVSKIAELHFQNGNLVQVILK